MPVWDNSYQGTTLATVSRSTLTGLYPDLYIYIKKPLHISEIASQPREDSIHIHKTFFMTREAWMVKARAKRGESLDQKVKRVHISHPKMLLNIPDTRTMWSNCRVQSLTKIINCCLLVGTIGMDEARPDSGPGMPKLPFKWHDSGIYNDDNAVYDQWDSTSNYKHVISPRSNEDHVRQLTRTMSFVNQIIGKRMGRQRCDWGRNRVHQTKQKHTNNSLARAAVVMWCCRV